MPRVIVGGVQCGWRVQRDRGGLHPGRRPAMQHPVHEA